jgi:hypothetical protein
MLIVGVAPHEVEPMLAAGVGPTHAAGAACPACGGELRGTWRGYARSVRRDGRVWRLAIRRARCTSCRRTHALLPSFVVPRRLDAARAVHLALALAAAGWGHRPIAGRLALPASTVRGWLRRLRARALAHAARLWALADGLGAPPARPPPGLGALAALARALGACARAARRRLGPGGLPGRAGLLVAVIGPGLLAHTDSP